MLMNFTTPQNQSTIDLVFSSDSDIVNSCTVISPLANSDHSSILISLCRNKVVHPVKKKYQTVWRYDAADWEKAHECLANIPWADVITPDVNTSWIQFKNIFMDIIKICVPHKRVLMKKNLPWLTKPLVRQIQKRNQLFHTAKKKKSGQVWQKYYNVRNKVVRLLRKAKRQYFANISVQSTPKKFWSTMKLKNRSKSAIPTLFSDGKELCSDNEKAEALNEFFSKCFNRSLPPLGPQLPFESLGCYCPPEFLCEPDRILELLLAVDNNKASGPDGISPRMLKGTAHAIAVPLAMLFNFSLLSGSIPHEWKTSNVVPASTQRR